MSDKDSGNLDVSRLRDPFTLTIFGATGDLTHRKLMPALYSLFRQRLLPAEFAIVGFARREYDDAGFRAWIAASVREYAAVAPEPALLDEFCAHLFYHRGDLEAGPEPFAAYAARLAAGPEFPPNQLVYLSVKPDLFERIIVRLHGVGLIHPAADPAWTRVVIEKPFGHDLASAIELNRACLRHLDEAQIYRIDHYLGKETVQNVMSFRFANAIFEPLFTNQFVDHIQITAAETVGMEAGRGAYYDETGALRDMLQNHLLQLLCLVTMEPPSRMTADSIRNEKVKVLQSVAPFTPGCVDALAVRAQYAAGDLGGKPVPGYLQEERIRPDSTTPTFVAVRIGIENWRWSGVPIYLRTGKRLARRASEVVVQFKVPPLHFFQTVECVGDVCDFVRARPNRLVFRIQPQEGIALRFAAKRPAVRFLVEDVEMDFSYSGKWPRALPEAYERLLLDVARGDSTLFTRSDEVEAAWGIVEPILRAWAPGVPAPLYTYPAGSWGPPEANGIFANGDTDWHNP